MEANTMAEKVSYETNKVKLLWYVKRWPFFTDLLSAQFTLCQPLSYHFSHLI